MVRRPGREPGFPYPGGGCGPYPGMGGGYYPGMGTSPGMFPGTPMYPGYPGSQPGISPQLQFVIYDMYRMICEMYQMMQGMQETPPAP